MSQRASPASLQAPGHGCTPPARPPQPAAPAADWASGDRISTASRRPITRLPSSRPPTPARQRASRIRTGLSQPPAAGIQPCSPPIRVRGDLLHCDSHTLTGPCRALRCVLRQNKTSPVSPLREWEPGRGFETAQRKPYALAPRLGLTTARDTMHGSSGESSRARTAHHGCDRASPSPSNQRARAPSPSTPQSSRIAPSLPAHRGWRPGSASGPPPRALTTTTTTAVFCTTLPSADTPCGRRRGP
ncbi:hypothetical protein OBBRIDRAFT_632864 [Obba rivulosa]|uniref:Uncharacterized protein n=1 Tax=Obba rivulosa TaxID=1052685 RepID=A0A8E2B0K4_9APHY|nr:hypothetical protein OBBRIDRAFT_632864 [Obba rivulosa]